MAAPKQIRELAIGLLFAEGVPDPVNAIDSIEQFIQPVFLPILVIQRWLNGDTYYALSGGETFYSTVTLFARFRGLSTLSPDNNL